MLGVSLGLEPGGRLRDVAPPHDFRLSMPAGAIYTRTGAATGLTLSGQLSPFAPNAPQRTDRGLALEPARTNFALAAVGGTGITATANIAVGPDGAMTGGRIEKTDATTPRWSSRPTQMTVLPSTTYTASEYVKRDGADVTVSLEFNNNTNWGLVAWVATFQVTAAGVTANAPSACTSTVTGVGNGWYRIAAIFTTGTTVSAPSNPSFLTRLTGPSGHSVLRAFLQLEEGSVATSPIITTMAAVTRGLPIFIEPVPVGRTRALLNQSDASAITVTGLTPGGTFDVATAVIGAGKGAFGASELVTREWQE